MKLFERIQDIGRKRIIYKILGIKLSVKDKYAILESRINCLYELLAESVKVSQLMPARGEIREKQLFLTDLLKRFKDICDKNNINNWWLDSGTLLGAVRHKGFIPWDDDIDLCMLRKDYDKLLPILEEEFKDDEIFFVRQRAITMNNFQIRIRAKERNLGLDVFPVDNFYKSDLSEEEKANVTKDIKHATEVFNAKYNQKIMNEKDVQPAKKDMLRIQKEIVMKNKKETENNPALFFGIDFPCDAGGHLIMDNSMVFPLKELSFEGNLYPVPNDCEGYLTNFYGNYMGFPPSIKSICQF